MVTKQAGEVKRYEMIGGDFPAPDENGEFVRFADIAHLLKPQEPGEGWFREQIQEQGRIFFLQINRLKDELESLKAERAKVASGKLTCADCNAILARW